MSVERRDQVRLVLQENSYAALGSSYSKVGKIKNISRGGLAFEYIAGESGSCDLSQVDIFMTGQVFHIYNLPCKLVYDIDVHVPHVKKRYVKILTTKRCGIQFGELSQADRDQLDFFIESHTNGIASNKKNENAVI